MDPLAIPSEIVEGLFEKPSRKTEKKSIRRVRTSEIPSKTHRDSLMPEMYELVRDDRKTIEGRKLGGGWGGYKETPSFINNGEGVQPGDTFIFVNSGDPSAPEVMCDVVAVDEYFTLDDYLEECLGEALPGYPTIESGRGVYEKLWGKGFNKPVLAMHIARRK